MKWCNKQIQSIGAMNMVRKHSQIYFSHAHTHVREPVAFVVAVVLAVLVMKTNVSLAKNFQYRVQWYNEQIQTIK